MSVTAGRSRMQVSARRRTDMSADIIAPNWSFYEVSMTAVDIHRVRRFTMIILVNVTSELVSICRLYLAAIASLMCSILNSLLFQEYSGRLQGSSNVIEEASDLCCTDCT